MEDQWFDSLWCYDAFGCSIRTRSLITSSEALVSRPFTFFYLVGSFVLIVVVVA